MAIVIYGPPILEYSAAVHPQLDLLATEYLHEYNAGTNNDCGLDWTVSSGEGGIA